MAPFYGDQKPKKSNVVVYFGCMEDSNVVYGVSCASWVVVS